MCNPIGPDLIIGPNLIIGPSRRPSARLV
jgi:hypothetical protein